MPALPALAVAGTASNAATITPTRARNLLPRRHGNQGAEGGPAARARPCSFGKGRLLLDQRPRELLGVEGAEVLERLADADQFHRNAELGGDREGDSPFALPSAW